MSSFLGKDRRLGEFRILRELGRGGMGVVFEAIQQSLSRRVALKVLPSHISLDQSALERFQREAVVAGKLSHPGIAKVYAVGCDKGLHYFAMELIDGPSLESLIKPLRGTNVAELGRSLLEEAAHPPPEWVPGSAQPPFFAASAAWAAEIAEALSEAHRSKVLHRDVKPSNILLRQDGSPVLVDFGLSRDSMEMGLTRTGDAVGTPAYMSPEQARGESHLDQGVDIYGLGATLYELVTLRPPFEGKHPTQIMQRIVSEDPVDPCKLNRSLPRELANIILKCLEKDRNKRYHTAKLLAGDLRRFLAGDAVEARSPATAGSRLRKRLTRNKRVVAAYAVATCFAAVSFSGVAWWMGDLDRRRARETFDQAIAELASNRSDAAVRDFHEARRVLGDEGVRDAWLDALVSKARQLYKVHKHAEIRDLFTSAAATYRTSPVVRRWLDRAAGLGALEIRVWPADARLTVSRLDDRGSIKAPVRFTGSGLQVGRYLARATLPYHEDAVRVVQVDRDKAKRITLRTLPTSDVVPGTAYVCGTDDLPPFLIGRTEVTCRAFSVFLRTLPRSLRARYRPSSPGWDGDEPVPAQLEEPVRGVTMLAAEAYASWAGGHLPTVAELAAAGTLGAPWRYPWGQDFDPSRVVADPMKGRKPAQVGSKATGVSTVGCLDLVGNVAEYAIDRDARIVAFGGHYQSKPEDLTLSSFEAVDRTRGDDHVGFRVAYAMAPFERATEKTALELFEASGLPWRHTVVALDSDGKVTCRVGMHGHRSQLGKRFPFVSLDEGAQMITIPGGSGDFVVRGRPKSEPPEVLLRTIKQPGLSRRELMMIDMGAALDSKSETYAFDIVRNVKPKRVVEPLGGGCFRHRFLVRARFGETQFHTLSLPPRSRILRSYPEPVEERASGSERLLTFRIDPAKPTPTGQATLFETAPVEVVFLADAMLGVNQPIDSLEPTLRSFLTAWNEGDVLTLEKIVDPKGFTYGANAVGWLGLKPVIRPSCPRNARLRFDPKTLRIVSIATIGSTARVSATVERPELGVSVPMFFTFDAQGSRYRLLEAGIEAQIDAGGIDADVYRHEMLDLRVPREPDLLFERLDRFPLPMQLGIRPTFVYTLKDTASGKVYTMNCSILLLGGESEAGPELSLTQRADRMLADAFPFFSRSAPAFTAADAQHGLAASGTCKVGDRSGASFEVFELTQPWAVGGRRKALAQERVLMRVGTVSLLAVCTVSSDSAAASLTAYKNRYHEFFRRVLATIDF